MAGRLEETRCLEVYDGEVVKVYRTISQRWVSIYVRIVIVGAEELASALVRIGVDEASCKE
jgi:hypothetical protein